MEKFIRITNIDGKSYIIARDKIVYVTESTLRRSMDKVQHVTHVQLINGENIYTDAEPETIIKNILIKDLI